MTGGGGLCHRNGYLSCVPVSHVLLCNQLSDTVGVIRVLSEALLNSSQVVLETIEHQDRLSVCRFDEIFQRVQLLIMDDLHVVVLIVAGTISQLEELASQGRCVQRQNVTVRIAGSKP